MPNFTKVFQGISKREERQFLLTVLKELRSKGFTKVCIPFSGELTLARVAVEAGFLPEAVLASDINLYPSVLGFFYAGTPLSELKLIIPSPLGEEFDAIEDEAGKAAWVIWLMKVLQFKEEVDFENEMRRHLVATKDEQIAKLTAGLKKAKARMDGINYRIEDARLTLADPWIDEQTVVLCHPPSMERGYEKQFEKFADAFGWRPSFSEFSVKNEFVNLFYESTLKPGLFLWSSYRVWDEIPPEHYVFAKQLKQSDYEFTLASDPAAVADSKVLKGVVFKKEKLTNPGYPIVPDTYIITEKTKITMKTVGADVAMYYRDLWAHKLGVTKGEKYQIMLLDGMVFGVVGWNLSECVRLVSDEILEVFGFNSPLPLNPTCHRLFMMCLCCDETRKLLMGGMKKNRIFEMRVFKTTCLSKYRKLKSSNGLLTIVEREQLPDGNYRILYKQPFYKRNFQGCLMDWLKENEIAAKRGELNGSEDGGE